MLSNSSVCVKMKFDGVFIVYQLSMFMLNFDTLSNTEVNFSYVCFFIYYVKIFKKLSSGGLEISFSILSYQGDSSKYPKHMI